MRRRFERAFNLSLPAFGIGDVVIALLLIALLYLGTRLAINAPQSVTGPDISLAPTALPWYAFLSTGRMAIAYLLSLLFTLVYGYAAARNRTARLFMLPLLDVLQSVPILSFLPIVLLSLTAILPQRFATELASIVLIVTSQAWNMTYSFYQSMTTIPTELREASSIFRFNPWLRFKTLELPFAAIGLIWNSMMSWAGGWFFLMASEIFTVGDKDFRLPGLGSYLQTAANQNNVPAILMGLGTLIVVIVLLDQLVWRPILVMADKYKVEMATGETAPESWFYDLLSRSYLAQTFSRRVWRPLTEKIDRTLGRLLKASTPEQTEVIAEGRPSIVAIVIGLAVLAGLAYAALQALSLLITLPLSDYGRILQGVLATLLRVAIALVIAVVWTIPVGVLIGSNQRAANILQPIVQVVASIPATALFPVIVLLLINLTGSLNVPAIILMLLGTQWYVLFNVIAGTSAIPQDLKYTTSLLQVNGWARWRTLILPALFPYLITGMITAGGGAWNASIVAEYIKFGGETYSATGVGALIAEATARGNFALLLASTLALILTVVTINRTLWRRLYKIAEDRFKME
jgi:NitT/TauT family transport system permease protein